MEICKGYKRKLVETNTVMMEEDQYIDLIRKILKEGDLVKGRNGNVYEIFGYNMRFSLKDGLLPLLTTKKVAWKTCFEELRWFLAGCTDNKVLKEKNVHIWDGNGSREYLDSIGLTDRAEDDLGPVYGHQWRHFNASYETCHTDYKGKGVDQLAQVIECLKDPSKQNSRRIIMCAWNPEQMNEMALPPCHVLAQFHVKQGKYLSCSLYQRSGDVGLGVPFNIASYSFLTYILAKHCGLEPYEFVYFLGNAHIYQDHVQALETQISRDVLSFPRIFLKNKHENIEDYTLDDFEWITPYKHHGPIKMNMSA